MKRTLNLQLILLFFIIFLFPLNALADDWYEKDEGYFSMLDEAGEELTLMAREIFVDDEYISSENKHYKIVKVDKVKKQAVAKLIGEVKLPPVEQANAFISVLSLLETKGSVLIYCTHSDESYVPSDGKASIPGKGGIFDVAEAFKNALNKKNVNAVLDKTSHDPHDAGAYRRSQRTAIELIKKNMPVAAVFDIHRDAVPSSVYATKVDGQPMTKVRIVLGGRNQNRKANEELAYKIKAVADKAYPGLIKDIFIGRGAYNQELSPRSLLLEFGAYKNAKESAKKASQYLADVISKSLYGGTLQGQNQAGESTGRDKVSPLSQQNDQGGGRGILWLLGILVIGGVAFLFLSTGGKEISSKITNFTRQEFSSFLGRKKRK